MKRALSIIIPAKNEMFLRKTVEDIYKHMEGDTEIIVVLDGYTTEEPVLWDDERLIVIKNTESKGQRAATNQACLLSEATYIMKVDAHCAFDQGFDVKMMSIMQPNYTAVPVMRNLHAFNWVCEDGHTRYQGPSGPCAECGKPTVQDVVWIPKTNPQSTSYCFDETPHFQYYNQYKKFQTGDLVETMSLQGSCFMLTREKYWELNICDEALGSWGSQGIEVACKTWLSGGRVVVNKNTYYAHMFRTQGGDFGFPYEQSGRKVEGAKKQIRELFFDNKWDKQIYPLSWLLDRFGPVPGWSEDMLTKVRNWPLPKKLTAGVLYYTDNELAEPLFTKCQEQIKASVNGHKLVSVSLKPINMGENYVLEAERSVLTMFRQILEGLYRLDTDVVFFCEHDVFYHKSHFDFVPKDRNIYYYNMNLWRVRQTDGFAIKYDHKSLSQLCAYRDKLITEFENRVKRVEEQGFNNGGYEPGTRSIKNKGFSDDSAEGYYSKFPNIDVRHENNLSRSKWRPQDFVSQRSCRNWQESKLELIEGWTDLKL